MSDPRPTLLVTSNHTITSLWKELSQNYDLCIVGQQAGLAQELGIEGAFPLIKYVTPDINETAINAAYKLSAKLFDAQTSASLASEIEEWIGGDVPEQLTADKMCQWWPAMVGEHVRQEASLIEAMGALMNDRKVVGCLVHEDVTPDMRVMVSYCKTKGVPTIHVPHANCFYMGKQWDIHTESISDYIAASGAYAKDFYARWGHNDTRIRITGSPELDSWYSNNTPSKTEARKVLGIGEADFVIIYASSWGQLTSLRGEFEDEFAHSLKEILATAKEMKATLVVRVHMGEVRGQEEMYLNAMKEAGVNGCATRSFNEYVLRAGDVLVAHGPSNTCTQAAIIGLPSCYFPTQDFEFPFGPIRVDGNLSEAIYSARDKDKNYWNAFAKAMNDPHDCFENGSACERAVDFVREICRD